MNYYRWTYNSDCEYGSKLRTVNATDYAALQAVVTGRVCGEDLKWKDYQAGRRTNGASNPFLCHPYLDRCASL